MQQRTCITLLLIFTCHSTDAAPPSDSGPRRTAILNVELTAAGELPGRVIDDTGAGRPNTPVTVTVAKQQFCAVTDQDGRFRMTLPKGGLCIMKVDGSTYACRAWRSSTAPPRSLRSIALVKSSDSLVRAKRRNRQACPPDCDCDECQEGHCRPESKYGLAVLAAGGAAAYMALSRDNASD